MFLIADNAKNEPLTHRASGSGYLRIEWQIGAYKQKARRTADGKREKKARERRRRFSHFSDRRLARSSAMIVDAEVR